MTAVARVDLVIDRPALPQSRIEQLLRELCTTLGVYVETTVVRTWATVERYTLHLYEADPDRVEAEALLWLAAHGLDYTVRPREDDVT